MLASGHLTNYLLLLLKGLAIIPFSRSRILWQCPESRVP
jgi:hypothetical protein